MEITKYSLLFLTSHVVRLQEKRDSLVWQHFQAIRWGCCHAVTLAFPPPVDIEGRYDILNPDVGPFGLPFIEGDIVFDPLYQEYQDFETRKGITGTEGLWPKNENGIVVVPFHISDTDPNYRAAIIRALELWRDNTCIVFKQLKDKNEPISHLNIIRDKGCWSFVGRNYYKSGQDLSIGSRCLSLGTIAHEIGHALGFYHEHSRSDRNEHIIVKFKNIQDGMEKNFVKGNTLTVVPYDYTSVMHYGSKYFSVNGEDTLMAKDPFQQHLLGNRKRLTFRDIKMANIMYGCIDTWASSCGALTPQCHNEGYVFKDCSCVCPPGTSGANCEIVTGGYYPDLECGGNITEPTVITTPNYPNNFPAGSRCSWWIQAPFCKKVKVSFNSFKLWGRERDSCRRNSLEIRKKGPFVYGKVFCGSEIGVNKSFKSAKNEMFLEFAGVRASENGFSASVSFIDDPKC